MIKTSSFLGVGRGDFDWLVYLVSDEYWLESQVGREFTHLLEAVFAREIGYRSAVVVSFPQDHNANMDAIFAKPWPEGVRRQLVIETNPLLLILASDLGTFDPEQERYAIVSIPSDRDEAREVLRELASWFQSGEDVIGELTRQDGPGRHVWRRVSSAVSLEPGAFGISVDLKRLFWGR